MIIVRGVILNLTVICQRYSVNLTGSKTHDSMWGYQQAEILYSLRRIKSVTIRGIILAWQTLNFSGEKQSSIGVGI